LERRKGKLGTVNTVPSEHLDAMTKVPLRLALARFEDSLTSCPNFRNAQKFSEILLTKYINAV